MPRVVLEEVDKDRAVACHSPERVHDVDPEKRFDVLRKRYLRTYNLGGSIAMCLVVMSEKTLMTRMRPGLCCSEIAQVARGVRWGP